MDTQQTEIGTVEEVEESEEVSTYCDQVRITASEGS
jgi:hypothetical protein